MSNRPTLADANRVLNERFGFAQFRAGQERAVESVLAGRDTLVVLPTGGGKSVCYQVPGLVLPGLTVVLSPLISLMKDQVDQLSARGMPAAFINSTLTSGEVSDRFARVQRGEIKLLYLAPERFDAGATAERLRRIGVSLLAVDEAHCISEWGHDFRPSYRRVGRLREALGAPPTIALTATATPEVREDIARQLALREPTVVVSGFDRKNLSYHVVPTRSDEEKDRRLVGSILGRDGLAVVYASTRKNVERITRVLERAGISAVAYHAGLDDDHRRDVQDAFMGGKVRAIVATNAFGMGVDKPDVRLVVHHAMPGTLEAYYQEAGRAGRDGKHSDCVLLHSFPDRFTHEFFIKGSFPERPVVEAVYEALRRAADRTGLVTLGPTELVPLVREKVNDRAVESSLRVLAGGGAIAAEPESQSRVFIRLLATPDRITRELSGAPMEIGLLRALWRAVGKRIQTGAAVDLDGLPPGFGGGVGALPILGRLEERQFLVWERTGGGTRLADPGKPLSAFNVDWALLDRRRRADLAKLDAMQQYAYTKQCRRGFVLRYFGDPEARAKCEGCDNCLGTWAPAEEKPQVERRARSRTSGSRRPSAGSWNGSSPSGGAATEARTEIALEGEDAELFASLRTLRGSIAKDEKVPAYVVFPDRTLAEMALRRPRSLGAMSDIRGVGPAKLEKYGERFLEAIRES